MERNVSGANVNRPPSQRDETIHKTFWPMLQWKAIVIRSYRASTTYSVYKRRRNGSQVPGHDMVHTFRSQLSVSHWVACACEHGSRDVAWPSRRINSSTILQLKRQAFSRLHYKREFSDNSRLELTDSGQEQFKFSPKVPSTVVKVWDDCRAPLMLKDCHIDL